MWAPQHCRCQGTWASTTAHRPWRRYLLPRVLPIANPGALIAERRSARRWIAGIMSPGDPDRADGFHHTLHEFYIVRFVVGAAEAGFFPAVVVYLTHWFALRTARRRCWCFYAAMPLSYVVGSPLAGLLLGLSWLGLEAGGGSSSSKDIQRPVGFGYYLVYLTRLATPGKLAPLRGARVDHCRTRRRKKRSKSSLLQRLQALRHRDVILLTF